LFLLFEHHLFLHWHRAPHWWCWRWMNSGNCNGKQAMAIGIFSSPLACYVCLVFSNCIHWHRAPHWWCCRWMNSGNCIGKQAMAIGIFSSHLACYVCLVFSNCIHWHRAPHWWCCRWMRTVAIEQMDASGIGFVLLACHSFPLQQDSHCLNACPPPSLQLLLFVCWFVRSFIRSLILYLPTPCLPTPRMIFRSVIIVELVKRKIILKLVKRKLLGLCSDCMFVIYKSWLDVVSSCQNNCSTQTKLRLRPIERGGLVCRCKLQH